ncbi:MAG: diguanylate cyclase response regulator [Gammaproteobacteria bacterium]|nr:MAG: diguanylate cyclase response regulator [Gammaproteobacteria bacterium]
MKSINVLVVDGSAVFREMLETLMKRLGCTVTVEETGKEGLEKLKTKQYTLICIAYHLPDMEGADFCGQVRGIPKYQDTSLVMLTAEDNITILKRAMLAGATDIFNKQDIAQLETYVQRLVKRETRVITGRVLFVEDSPVLQIVIIDLLTDMGLDVDAYTRAEDAWSAFQQGGYDLVITDIVLEGSMSGVSLVRKIRRTESDVGEIPIIAASGFDNVSRRIELFNLGINDYIAKPIIPAELVERVYNQINTYHLMLELRSQQRSLYSLAMLDEQTQLFNRHSIREFSLRYFSDAERHKMPLSFALMDIDFFKKINEDYSYERGDKVLVELGMWLKRILRDGDMVVRWGGGEFLFILANCDGEAAATLMGRVAAKLKRLRPTGIAVTASIGISTMGIGEEHTLSSLIDLADRAVYKAKLAGRDRVLRFEEVLSAQSEEDELY